MFYFASLIKQCFDKLAPLKARVVLSVVTFLPKYTAIIKDTDITNCEVAKGEIEDMKATKQEHRGNTVYYYLEISINGEKYFINTANGVTPEMIEYFSVGNFVIVYFQSNEGINEIIRVET